jgi:glucose-like phosphotransferase system IIB component
MYYFVFRFIIKKFNLKTPGREDETVTSASESIVRSRTDSNTDYIQQLIEALGGQKNIKNLDACITRLRVQLFSNQGLQESAFKKLGASGVLFVGDGVQIIMGPRSENIKTQMEQYIKSGANKDLKTNSETLLLNLIGGKSNIENVQLVSNTRVRIVTKNINKVDIKELKKAASDGGLLAEIYSGNIVHILAGNKAEALVKLFN